jgi:branched-subunit amino acid aminotransferase/4-amino-4-deoxychorismate lyase
MTIPILDDQAVFEKMTAPKNYPSEEYYAFYSSWFGGVVKSPGLMVLPMDDHLAHRGDGVFEAMKAEGRSVYLMDAHLQRLFKSAESIALTSPFNPEKMKEI